jgi:hypothetical protein
MKKLSLIIAIVATAALAPNLHAAGKCRPRPAPAHTTIVSVSENSITIKEAKETKTFTITKETEIDYQGQRVSVSQLQPGMRVEVTSGMTAGVASRINASEAPKAPAAKK